MNFIAIGTYIRSHTSLFLTILTVIFCAGESVSFDDESNPHNVAGLIKLYLRELSEPLMTFALYDPFIATQRMSRFQS